MMGCVGFRGVEVRLVAVQRLYADEGREYGTPDDDQGQSLCAFEGTKVHTKGLLFVFPQQRVILR